jgi:hypothetical protein
MNNQGQAIGIHSNQSIWVTSNCLSPTTWTQVPGEFVQLAINDQGISCGIHAVHGVLCTQWNDTLKSLNPTWKLHLSPNATFVALDHEKICIVDPSSRLQCSSLASQTQFQIYKSPFPVSRVGISGSNACIVDTNSMVWCTCEFNQNLASFDWNPVGRLRNLSVAGRRMCGTDRNDNIFCMHDICQPEQEQFPIFGGLRELSLNVEGHVCGVNGATEIWCSTTIPFLPVLQSQSHQEEIPVAKRQSKRSKERDCYSRPRKMKKRGSSRKRRRERSEPRNEGQGQFTRLQVGTPGCKAMKPLRQAKMNRYTMEKVVTNAKAQHLRLTLNAAKRDGFQIWGTRCPGKQAQCRGKSRFLHQFTSRGDARHTGSLQVKEICIGGTCMREKQLLRLLTGLASSRNTTGKHRSVNHDEQCFENFLQS